jgi:hypothetical protein
MMTEMTLNQLKDLLRKGEGAFDDFAHLYDA